MVDSSEAATEGRKGALRKKSRDALKSELKERILELYEGELMDIYFTEFVTQ